MKKKIKRYDDFKKKYYCVCYFPNKNLSLRPFFAEYSCEISGVTSRKKQKFGIKKIISSFAVSSIIIYKFSLGYGYNIAAMLMAAIKIYNFLKQHFQQTSTTNTAFLINIQTKKQRVPAPCYLTLYKQAVQKMQMSGYSFKAHFLIAIKLRK